MLTLLLEMQRAWSLRTFGPGRRTEGLLNHIRKELKEIEQAPTDLEEWVDVAILAFDGAWRAGYSPDQIYAALVVKSKKNFFQRSWPPLGVAQDQPIEHVKE